jgi:hypothetical protein
LSDVLWDLFIQRKDTFAMQNKNGTYTRAEQEITNAILDEHLKGTITIGVYQFDKENNCKWICYDFDGQNLEEEFEKAKKLSTKLREEQKITSQALEFSGKKGYHLWIFINQTDGATAKYWATEMANGCEPHEIFPKQTSIGEKFGNLVKLPLGLHQVAQKESYFFDSDFQPLNREQGVALLEKILLEKKPVLPKIIYKEVIRTIFKSAVKQDMPDYVQHLINTGAKEGERHLNAWVIVKELYNSGFEKNEILKNVLTYNNNCSPPKPDYIVTNHANYLLQFPERYLAKESIETIPKKELYEISHVNHQTVTDYYKKWIHCKNTDHIDLCLAVAISRNHTKTQLWIILIAASGSGKSEILRPLEDKKEQPTTEIMSKITPNTFLSGMSHSKVPHVDFGETLQGKPTLFLTYDFSQFIKLDPKDKGQLWAQLRDLYDGFLERKAFDTHKKIDNIRVNWLICTTPVVDSELLVQQELGTRELIYRFDQKETTKKDLMQRVWDNSNKLDTMRKELNSITRAFIEKQEANWVEIEPSEKVKEELMQLAQTTATLRAATESDNFTGELTNFVYEEEPTRVLNQFKALFVALKNLDANYSDESALRVIQRVVLSSIHPIRLRILIELMKTSRLSTTEIQKRLSIGWKTVNTQLFTAKQLELVNFDETQEEEGQIRNWKKKVWYVTDHPVIGYLAKIRGLEEQWNSIYEKRFSVAKE